MIKAKDEPLRAIILAITARVIQAYASPTQLHTWRNERKHGLLPPSDGLSIQRVNPYYISSLLLQ